jgi:hypothetical protein
MALAVVVGSEIRADFRLVERASVGHPRFAFWWRITALSALFFGAYGVVFHQVLADALAGSRTAFLVVAPLLVAMSAAGYRTSPRGVGDNESDWIIAAVSGVVGLAVIILVTNRFPTLAGLWHLELVGALVWVACAGMIIFSVRHVLRMWQVWLFAFLCAITLPYLLATAALGGSDEAAVAVAAGLGAFAVYLAGRPTRRRWRIGAALLSLAIGLGLSISLTTFLGLFATELIAAGVVPLLAAIGLHHFTLSNGKHRLDAVFAGFHPLSVRSLAALALAAVALLVTHFQASSPPAPPTMRGDWAQHSGLVAPTEYPFASRFFGPNAKLVRFAVPPAIGRPAAVVDVISTTNLAALRNYSDAIWYPSPVPLNYQAVSGAGSDSQLPVDARVVHTNADTATDGSAQNWYAITWVWQVAAVYQQVTVVVNQAVGSADSPVAPAPLSVADTVAKPMLWMARQQPDSVGAVDPRVVSRANDIVHMLVNAAEPAQAPTTGEQARA